MSEQANAPWRDESLLRQKYVDEQKSCAEVADELGCHAGTVHTWLQKHEIETRNLGGSSSDDPHRDAEQMRKWYVEEKLTTREIADKCDVSQPTVCKWLEKHGIDKRKSNRERPPTYYTRQNGYEYVMSNGEAVFVHQLVAIANGADPYKTLGDLTHVIHHKKPIPWLNTPENVELVTQSEHRQEHGNQYTD